MNVDQAHKDALRRALRGMTTAERLVLLCRYCDRFTVEETAQIAGAPVETVRRIEEAHRATARSLQATYRPLKGWRQRSLLDCVRRAQRMRP